MILVQKKSAPNAWINFQFIRSCKNNSRIANVFSNKPKIAYSWDLADMDYHGLILTVMDFHGVS